jgi:DNA-binding transcriptional MerR regulator
MSRLRERVDAKLYYSISEASAIAKVKPHVLRYWETQFKMLRPKKNKAGNRMYRKRDLKLIQWIKELLYDKGYTIAGARRKLLDDRAALRDQLEIKFTDAERSTLLADIIRDLKLVLEDLKRLPGEAARRTEAEEAISEAREAAARTDVGTDGADGADALNGGEGHDGADGASDGLDGADGADSLDGAGELVVAESISHDDLAENPAESGQDPSPSPRILGS